MTKVLRQPALDGEARPLAATAATDPALQAALDEAAAAAYTRGLADGAARERAAGEHLAAAVGAALAEARSTARAELREDAGSLLRAALPIAEVVLGHAAHDDGDALTGRVATALARADDAPITIAVHPVDAGRLADLAAADPSLTVVADNALRPGEARLRGRWVDADLTQAATLAALAEVLAP